jgi:hypothetical protein
MLCACWEIKNSKISTLWQKYQMSGRNITLLTHLSFRHSDLILGREKSSDSKNWTLWSWRGFLEILFVDFRFSVWATRKSSSKMRDIFQKIRVFQNSEKVISSALSCKLSPKRRHMRPAPSLAVVGKLSRWSERSCSHFLPENHASMGPNIDRIGNVSNSPAHNTLKWTN